ncbi:actin-related protein 6 isoform X2 [Bombus pyrosoma]|uniref:actin-related protein 6 isoform X2 n=1 Tax=Bombus pyrosoma TaxID=396416 RepID=UPI001CB88BB2|nr:actin-related protein 6 isoform X2 [Bombus pyrosoma]XP_050470528.1 actin-related protein 6 isoform X2 [Bombus huntii]
MPIPNCIMKAKSERRRPFVGNQIEECRDASGLFYILPFQKGYLVNWDVQKTVWDYIFSKECCLVNLNQLSVIVTEPLFNFPTIQEAMTEIFFEEYECQSLLRINSSTLSCYQYKMENPNTKCCIVVDSGYSFTHIVPYINDTKVKEGIRRIDVGGKLLTNHLKEIISYRQLHVMDETYVINQVKEDSCFVSSEFFKDMETAKNKLENNPIVKDYVLPDYTTLRRGFLKNPEPPNEQQTLRLSNERFAIPEILFFPSDVGIRQMGIPEAIMDCLKACDEETWPHLLSNIILTGGNAKFPGFQERIYKEVRSLAPAEYTINVHLPENPITYAWHGGKTLSKDPIFSSLLVTREDYEEEGQNLCFERFDV